MKKGDRPNPGEEFLYHLFGQPKFNEYLIEYRRKIGISKYGLGRNVDWKKEWGRLINDKKTSFNLLVAGEHLQNKFKVPVAHAKFLYLYICFGYIPKEFNNEVEIVKILPPTHLLGPEDTDEEKELRTYFPDEPFAKILILGTSRKSDVIKFISEHWDEVEEILKGQGWTRPKTVRLTVNKERNLIVKELFRKKTSDLQKEAESKSTYKETLIQKIMGKRGYKMTDGQIRKLRYWK